jgi:hypothetical protein
MKTKQIRDSIIKFFHGEKGSRWPKKNSLAFWK